MGTGFLDKILGREEIEDDFEYDGEYWAEEEMEEVYEEAPKRKFWQRASRETEDAVKEKHESGFINETEAYGSDKAVDNLRCRGKSRSQSYNGITGSEQT